MYIYADMTYFHSCVIYVLLCIMHALILYISLLLKTKNQVIVSNQEVE